MEHYEYPVKHANQSLILRLLQSWPCERIMIFLTQEEAIKLQALNTLMYRKTEMFMPVVMGMRIESCIMVYGDYQDKNGAVSVVIGQNI